MRTKALSIATGLVLMAGVADAQLPGEPRPPQSYDPVGSMRYTFERGTPNETVREAQRALQTASYYDGPLDGVLGPETRRAIWKFQQAKGRRASGSLDRATIADLGLDAGSTPSASPSLFGNGPASRTDDVQAP
jgi:peptidoglycan hydrolase-like protein with peptidoglycan-binding domain